MKQQIITFKYKIIDILVEKTQTKPRAISEFKMIKSFETCSFDKLLETEEGLLVNSNLEAHISKFNKTEEQNDLDIEKQKFYEKFGTNEKTRKKMIRRNMQKIVGKNY